MIYNFKVWTNLNHTCNSNALQDKEEEATREKETELSVILYHFIFKKITQMISLTSLKKLVIKRTVSISTNCLYLSKYLRDREKSEMTKGTRPLLNEHQPPSHINTLFYVHLQPCCYIDHSVALLITNVRKVEGNLRL